ncbi:MAG: glycosyltransferase family 2 protein [Acidimicrobiia bacterium]|nr:MAG: glycosyltransferase family 2 protein [Acidimicrobiia bacterium]
MDADGNASLQAAQEGSVTIVVVTYNSAALLPDFFGALDVALAGVSKYEVVVADNASRDETLEVVKRLRPRATIVALESNLGYAAGINAAVAASDRSDAILVLNDDIRLAPGSVLTLMAELADSDVGVVVPRLSDGDGHLLLSQRREPTVATSFGEAVLGGRRAGSIAGLSEVVTDPGMYGEKQDVTWASGCAWLIAARCWDAVGQWDESLFLYGEDLDYALRLRDEGYRIRYTPDADAVHLVGPSQSNPRLWAMSMWNRYRVFARRHGRIRSALFWSGLVVNESLRSMRSSSIHRAGLSALLFRSKRPEEVR